MVGSGRRVTPARLGLLLLGRSGVLDRLALNASRCSLMFASTFAWKYDRIFLNMFYKIVKPTHRPKEWLKGGGGGEWGLKGGGKLRLGCEVGDGCLNGRTLT